MYSGGKGVPQDDREALRWFHLAAEQGSPEAELFLGLSYSNGRGVPQDFVEAYIHFSLAAALGSKGAPKHRDRAAEALSSASLLDAQAEAKKRFSKLSTD